MNIPLPPKTRGDAFLASFDQMIAPVSERFEPTWLIISAGFDAHVADPITDLGLSSGDYALLTQRLVQLVPPGRRLAVLEGGYDLGALRTSTAAVLAALAGVHHTPEEPTGGGPGLGVVEAVRAFWYEHGLL